ncbi:MAG: diadenosine tetraphosphatase [Kangiellaceae bacterium]|nr:diadenosine tetraphosphatase [Kangiellaceae bacterium]
MSASGYDIIGDIHGHANDLLRLLNHLGYKNKHGYFEHPERKVVFLGDFIDRGINQKQVLDIVIPMVKERSALAIMGNHEFNALAFHTKDPLNPDAWLRKRTDKNIHQHLAFLNDYAGPKQADALAEVLAFFYALPLWIDLEEFRAIHASWHPTSLEYIKPQLSPAHQLDTHLLAQASKPHSPAFDAIENLLKGVDVRLPNELFFFDKDGTKRRHMRIKWWLNKANTLADLAIGRFDKQLHQIPAPPDIIVGYPEDAKPVFVGHYWMSGQPKPLKHNVACLDYSVAKNGKLVAYRWEGESTIDETHFVYVA